jgi:hypothetical protein
MRTYQAMASMRALLGRGITTLLTMPPVPNFLKGRLGCGLKSAEFAGVKHFVLAAEPPGKAYFQQIDTGRFVDNVSHQHRGNSGYGFDNADCLNVRYVYRTGNGG